jgi:hypothetical protein
VVRFSYRETKERGNRSRAVAEVRPRIAGFRIMERCCVRGARTFMEFVRWGCGRFENLNRQFTDLNVIRFQPQGESAKTSWALDLFWGDSCTWV